MKEFYVSTQGCDTNPGTKAQPVCSIEAAQKLARASEKPVKVLVLEGNYCVKGLSFDERDSDTVYEAVGYVVLDGGVILNGEDFCFLNLEEKERLHGDAKEKVLKVDLKKYGLTAEDWGEITPIGTYTTAYKYDGVAIGEMWCELFVDDQRMQIARYPNEGFIYTEEIVRVGDSLQKDGKIINPNWENERNHLSDIRQIAKEDAQRAASWKSHEDLWIYGYPRYDWADESNPVACLNVEKGTLETKYVSRYGVKEHAPYYFFNVFEELDVPGEWYLDRKNGILYVYPPTDIQSAEIRLSITTKNLLEIQEIDNFTFSGFCLCGTRGDGIVAKGNRITIQNCEIKSVSGYGIRMEGMNCTVKDCHIHSTGKGGVFIAGGDRKKLESSGNVVTNNHIHHMAEIYKTYNPAICFFGVNCIISHNEIHDAAHQAIMFSGNEHVIEYNEIYDVCTYADDSSAIYCGRDYTNCGSILRYNYLHDIYSRGDNYETGVFAIYFDDNNGGNSVYGNVMQRCQSAIHLHGGQDMIFRNNLIIDHTPNSHNSISFMYCRFKHFFRPGGCHEAGIKGVGYFESEIWQKKYPCIAEYLTRDPDKEQGLPHNCDISDNIIINHKPICKWFGDMYEDAENYIAKSLQNKMSNNIEIADSKFAGIPKGKMLDLSHNRFDEIIPNFPEIPFELMGRVRAEVGSR